MTETKFFRHHHDVAESLRRPQYSYVFLFNAAVKAKYKFGLLGRRFCPDNSDTDFIAHLKKMKVLMKTDEAMVTPLSFSGDISTTSHNLVCAIGGTGLSHR